MEEVIIPVVHMVALSSEEADMVEEATSS
jgi:hypothetical protein